MIVTTLSGDEVAYLRQLADEDIRKLESLLAAPQALAKAGVTRERIAAWEKRLTVARSALKNLIQNAPRTGRPGQAPPAKGADPRII